MGTESFSKGLVEIISSSNESAKIEGEFLQVLQALNTNSEACLLYTSPSPRDRG